MTMTITYKGMKEEDIIALNNAADYIRIHFEKKSIRAYDTDEQQVSLGKMLQCANISALDGNTLESVKISFCEQRDAAPERRHIGMSITYRTLRECEYITLNDAAEYISIHLEKRFIRAEGFNTHMRILNNKSVHGLRGFSQIKRVFGPKISVNL